MANISLVIPCFNEEQALPQTAHELTRIYDRLLAKGAISKSSSIYLIDDGSSDRTWDVITAIADQAPQFKGIKLSRNQGHQSALLAGLFIADGDAVISLDADLQDDVDVIEKMVDAFHEGIEVVYAVRNSRETDTKFKRITANAYYSLLRGLGAEVIPNHADYRMLGRRALEALKQFKEVNLYLRGIIPMLGFPSTVIYYERGVRVAGTSKYPLKKMLALAVNGITSLSAVPLRLISAFGAVLFFLSMAISIWVLGVRFLTNQAVPGWASITLPIYALGGIQMLCLGVVGEYVAKIYMESKNRPRFFIESTYEATANSKPTAISFDRPSPIAQ